MDLKFCSLMSVQIYSMLLRNRTTDSVWNHVKFITVDNNKKVIVTTGIMIFT